MLRIKDNGNTKFAHLCVKILGSQKTVRSNQRWTHQQFFFFALCSYLFVFRQQFTRFTTSVVCCGRLCGIVSAKNAYDTSCSSAASYNQCALSRSSKLQCCHSDIADLRQHCHNSKFVTWCIMNWLYINYQLLCTDYYLFIKHYFPLHVSSLKCSSSRGYSCTHAAYGAVTLYESSWWPVGTQLEWELTVGGRLLVGRLSRR